MTTEYLHPDTRIIACSIDGDRQMQLRDLPGEGPWCDVIRIPIRICLADGDGCPGEDIATLRRRDGDVWEVQFKPGFAPRGG